MNVSIILLNHNGFELTRACLDSILHHVPQVETIVVDNHSIDGSVAKLREEFPAVRFFELPENEGFGKANNAGARRATGSYLLFLNNDTIFEDDAVTKLRAVLDARPDVGAVGPRLLNPDHSLQLSFGYDPSLINEWRVRRLQKKFTPLGHLDRERLERQYPSSVEVDWLTGAALMVRREAFEGAGGFDEGFFMYFEDADLCRAMRMKGWKILYDPTSHIIHLRGGTVGTLSDGIRLEYRRSQLRYYRKHRSIVSQILLRFYLFLKFSFEWLVHMPQDSGKAAEANRILKLVLREQR